MANIQGVSNCYVFKSRLQEYSQKVGLPTPVYETIKEGPSHDPTFMSTVIVNDVRFDSLTGFFNRKAAEQSAAEVALIQLSRSGEMKECITQPVHETGLCKNLLQEYAQKMNYAVPLYTCIKDDTGRKNTYSCTVEIGPIKYIGAFASTKKESELRAARTALLAIQSFEPENSDYTVLPVKKKPANSGMNVQESTSVLKTKKTCLKKRLWKKKKRQKHAAACDDQVDGENSNVSLLQVCNHKPNEPKNEVCHDVSVENVIGLDHFDVSKHVDTENPNDALVQPCCQEEIPAFVNQSSFIIVKNADESL